MSLSIVPRLRNPQDAAAAGVAMLPGNRKQQGVFAAKSIAFNISSAHLRHLAKLGFWFDRRRERERGALGARAQSRSERGV